MVTVGFEIQAGIENVVTDLPVRVSCSELKRTLVLASRSNQSTGQIALSWGTEPRKFGWGCFVGASVITREVKPDRCVV